jgi:hypothetical protein
MKRTIDLTLIDLYLAGAKTALEKWQKTGERSNLVDAMGSTGAASEDIAVLLKLQDSGILSK